MSESFKKLTDVYDSVVLVLQGGGALGAYQGGVFEALAEHDIQPSWISGVSIGAINAAVIAGNPPERRATALKEFWHTIAPPTTPTPLDAILQAFMLGEDAQVTAHKLSAFRAMMVGQPGFFRPRLPWSLYSGAVAETSYYDTKPLKDTLERLVDFDRINAGDTRVSFGAVNVRTGNYIYFDNTTHKIKAEHIMASGALPPGFPAVEIDGEFYWDGGLVSNTPLFQVLEDTPRRNMLVFQVDLWSAHGTVPSTMAGVLERQKDITYSSRTRLNTDSERTAQALRNATARLLDKLPPSMADDPDVLALRKNACPALINIVHLIYQRKRHELDNKDYEFSNQTMRAHWDCGLEDTLHSLEHRDWLKLPTGASGTVTHDAHRDHEKLEDLDVAEDLDAAAE